MLGPSKIWVMLAFFLSSFCSTLIFPMADFDLFDRHDPSLTSTIFIPLIRLLLTSAWLSSVSFGCSHGHSLLLLCVFTEARLDITMADFDYPT